MSELSIHNEPPRSLRETSFSQDMGVWLLTEKFNVQAEIHEKFAEAFVKVLDSQNSIKEQVKDVSRDISGTLQLLKDSSEVSAKIISQFKDVLTVQKEIQVKVDLLHIARVTGSELVKRLWGYFAATITLIALVEALIQLGVLKLVWGTH